MELISVIVPVYQVKDYLAECVEALLNQTYPELEIILVDDGSTDGSEKLCDEYGRKDERVKVIHQKNGGLSCARNSGLQLAKGDYIAFVDSDDAVSERFLEKLYHLLKEYRADIAVCAYTRGQDWALSKGENGKEYCLDAKKMLQEWHGKRKKLETVVWNKLYCRNVLGEADGKPVFPEGKLHEDTYVSHLFVNRANRIAITESELYFYRLRKESITKSRVTEESVLQDLEAQLARLSFFRREGYKGSRDRLLWGFLLHVVWYCGKLRKH